MAIASQPPNAAPPVLVVKTTDLLAPMPTRIAPGLVVVVQLLALPALAATAPLPALSGVRALPTLIVEESV